MSDPKGISERASSSRPTGRGGDRARPVPDPIAPDARRAAAIASLLVLAAATVGAAIRLLPWALDPTIPWATLAPFAKSLFAVAFEAAILTGWPVGWALAAQRSKESGQARVLATLGESPAATLKRLAPQAIFLAVVLAISSLAFGQEAAAPGKIVNALLDEGRAACRPTKTHGVPFVSATWLCHDDGARLVGRAPVGGVVFTANRARVSDDLRRIELGDARLVLQSGSAPPVRVHVDTLVLRGLAPWARASTLPPALRAVVVTLSGLVAAAAAAFTILRARRRIGSLVAVATGASGPLAALALLRALELRLPDPSEPTSALLLASFVLVPLVAFLAVVTVTTGLALLPERRRADSK